jgi:hypothetical protein
MTRYEYSKDFLTWKLDCTSFILTDSNCVSLGESSLSAIRVWFLMKCMVVFGFESERMYAAWSVDCEKIRTHMATSLDWQ